MDWVNKIWGRTRELIYTPFYAKYELEVEAGTYCSLHYHENRANRFQVLSGQINLIYMYGPKINNVILGPDNLFSIPSFVPHMFYVIKSGTVIEEYYPDRNGTVMYNDIVRIIEGGKSLEFDEFLSVALRQIML